MVIGLVVWNQIGKVLVTCKGSSMSCILDYSTVFALDRVVPGKRRALGRSLKAALVRPQSFFFLIFFNHREILSPLSPQVLKTGARFFKLGQVRAATGDTSKIFWLRSEELFAFLRFILRCWESLSDLTHA